MEPPPHEPVSPFGDATINPEGKLSVNAMPVRVPDEFGLLIVKVRLVLAFSEMEVAPKLSLMDGGPEAAGTDGITAPMYPFGAASTMYAPLVGAMPFKTHWWKAASTVQFEQPEIV